MVATCRSPKFQACFRNICGFHIFVFKKKFIPSIWRFGQKLLVNRYGIFAYATDASIFYWIWPGRTSWKGRSAGDATPALYGVMELRLVLWKRQVAQYLFCQRAPGLELPSAHACSIILCLELPKKITFLNDSIVAWAKTLLVSRLETSTSCLNSLISQISGAWMHWTFVDETVAQ